MEGNRTLGKRLIIVYIGLIILPFTLLFLFFSIRSFYDVRSTYIDFMEKNNLYVNRQIEQVVQDVHKFASSQMLDKAIEGIIAKEDKQQGMEFVQDIKTMSSFIQSVNSLKTPYYDVAYVGINGEFYSNKSPEFDLSKDVYIEYLDRHKKTGEILTISPIVGLAGQDHIVFIRTLRSSETLKYQGYCMVSLSLKEMKRYLGLGNIDQSIDGEFLVVNNEEIIYNAGSKEFDEKIFNNQIKPILKESWEKETSSMTIGGERLLVTKQLNESTGWTILQYKPINMINHLMLSSVFIYIWTMLPLFISFILIAGYISRKVIRPINHMISAMKHLEKSQFKKIDEAIIGHDEMGYLMNSYNNTVTKLEETIHRQYVAELYENKAKIKMLESQVNPHFLYNALNTMSSIAEINDVGEISLMASSLSEMLRFNLQNASVVMIEEELAQVENYLAIQQVRFRDRFIFKKDVEEHVMKWPIMKFLIQPLIENAFYHGLEKQQSGGIVELVIKEVDNHVRVEVKDNGIGIPAKTLEKLRARTSKTGKEYLDRGDHASIGLENTNFRLKAHYGIEYGLTIESEEGKYTYVSFLIPIQGGDINDGANR